MVTNGESDGYQNNADLGKGVQKAANRHSHPIFFVLMRPAIFLAHPRQAPNLHLTTA
jgi:hypothetical protein